MTTKRSSRVVIRQCKIGGAASDQMATVAGAPANWTGIHHRIWVASQDGNGSVTSQRVGTLRVRVPTGLFRETISERGAGYEHHNCLSLFLRLNFSSGMVEENPEMKLLESGTE